MPAATCSPENGRQTTVEKDVGALLHPLRPHVDPPMALPALLRQQYQIGGDFATVFSFSPAEWQLEMVSEIRSQCISASTATEASVMARCPNEPALTASQHAQAFPTPCPTWPRQRGDSSTSTSPGQTWCVSRPTLGVARSSTTASRFFSDLQQAVDTVLPRT